MKKKRKTIYKVVYEKYFNESRVKKPKYFLTEFKEKFNVTQLITLDIKKKIQQAGLKYVLLSKIVKIKIEIVVVVQKSSKANLKIYLNEENNKQSTK